MKRLLWGTCLAATVAGGSTARAQSAFLSNLSATRHTPIYTTYAAALERSGFVLDEGYHLRYYDPEQPIEYVTDKAGSWGISFALGNRWVSAVKDMAAEPVITTSYGDIVRYNFRPFAAVRVHATFLVYSSRIALNDVVLENTGSRTITVTAATYIRGALSNAAAQPDGSIHFAHREPPDNWTMQQKQPHVTNVSNVVMFSAKPGRVVTQTESVAAHRTFVLKPGARASWRVVRAVAPADSAIDSLRARARALMTEPLDRYVHANENLYKTVPPAPTTDPRKQLLYWGAFTLLRQVMLPPEGATRFPYYVFSREPQWGWGHGGQVFHESLSMLAYALMDPTGAMNSQRVFAERQHADGYIPYRTGPYLEETIVHEGERTTSAPWYAWQNWEIYQITRDRAFLQDMYASSKRFYEWLTRNRDRDGDGLYEWGAHGVLESVRDGKVAVWDQVGWPANFEALDLSTMMVAEAEALATMAQELGSPAEAAQWRAQADGMRRRNENTFWDEQTGFYYHVDQKLGGFTHKKANDLKRREIIGFLPLWAGTASDARAKRLIETLTDSTAFWRRHGVPSLAADDPYYNASGYWNGPVWVEWNYLIQRGLLRYGRADLARELTSRVADGMIAQLEKNHVFWEIYGPDGGWAGHHHAYIWAGLIARMMLDAPDLK